MIQTLRFLSVLLIASLLCGCGKAAIVADPLPTAVETASPGKSAPAEAAVTSKSAAPSATASGDPGILSDGSTVCTRFPPPQGFLRKPVADGSFAQYLRDFPLLPDGAPVCFFDGSEKEGSPHMAVLDLSVGTRDLQQCADSVIRLRAEYLYGNAQYSSIAFHFTNGFLAKYSKWRQGWRVSVKGNDVSWVRNGRDSASRESFDKYLNIIFNYAGTRSLEKELIPASDGSLCIGDVFIHGGSPGHCVIVMDIAQSSDGRKAFLLAQGFMPAQSMHIIMNPATGGAWYFTGVQGALETQDYTFEDAPRRFAD